MPQFAYDETTGLEYILDESTGEWTPFIDTEDGAEAALVSAGGALRQMGRGIADLFGGDRAALQQSQREDDALLAPLREARPVSTFVGDVLPGLATAPIGGTAALAGRLGLGASAAISSSLGAIEGLLRLDPNETTQLDSVLTNTLGALAGEGAGRLAGRVVNSVMGAGSSLTRNEGIEALLDEGLEALPSERLANTGVNIDPLVRLEQGAQAGVFTPGVFRRIRDQRANWINNTAARSVGLREPVESLTPDVLARADDQISDGFEGLIREATEGGGRGTVLQIDDGLADRILNTRGQVKELYNRGRFQGLNPDIGGNSLTPSEALIARRALAQDAANAASRGEHELAEDIFADVDSLDGLLQVLVDDPEWISRHARLREQYRNLQVLMRQGVIGQDGNISARTLNNRLGQKTAYGRVYQQQRLNELQPETAELFGATRQLSAPELQPFRSSGTAENQAIRDLGGAVATAVQDPIAGGAGLATRLYAPLVLSTLGGTNRGASVLGGLLQPAGALYGRGGGEIGPGIIEAMLAERVTGANANDLDEGN